LKRPLEYVSYVLKYIGSQCAQYGNAAAIPDGALALVFGVGALAVLGWALWALVWPDPLKRTALRPYLGMVAYSILSALMTGVGRAGFGK